MKINRELIWFIFSKPLDFLPYFLLILTSLAALILAIPAIGTEKFELAPSINSSIGLFFGLLLFFYYIRERRSTYLKKHVPFLVTVGSKSEYRDMVNEVNLACEKENIPIDDLKREFHLEDDDWRLHLEGHLPDDASEWMKALRDTNKHFRNLAKKLPGEKAYHIFFRGPTMFALAFGAMIGVQKIYAFHHYQPGGYHKQIDFSNGKNGQAGIRSLVTDVEDYSFIHRKDGSESIKGEVVVAIDLSGRGLTGDAKRLAEKQNMSFVRLYGDFGGEIPLDEDWIRITRELHNRIAEILDKEEITRIHLCVNMPNAIAFALGSSLAEFKPISLWHWFFDQSEYDKVFDLEKIEKQLIA